MQCTRFISGMWTRFTQLKWYNRLSIVSVDASREQWARHTNCSCPSQHALWSPRWPLSFFLFLLFIVSHRLFHFFTLSPSLFLLPASSAVASSLSCLFLYMFLCLAWPPCASKVPHTKRPADGLTQMITDHFLIFIEYFSLFSSLVSSRSCSPSLAAAAAAPFISWHHNSCCIYHSVSAGHQSTSQSSSLLVSAASWSTQNKSFALSHTFTVHVVLLSQFHWLFVTLSLSLSLSLSILSEPLLSLFLFLSFFLSRLLLPAPPKLSTSCFTCSLFDLNTYDICKPSRSRISTPQISR